MKPIKEIIEETLHPNHSVTYEMFAPTFLIDNAEVRHNVPQTTKKTISQLQYQYWHFKVIAKSLNVVLVV